MKTSPAWKGEEAGYFAFHEWLRSYYGKAYHCENPECDGKSKRFEWSLLRGKEHGHIRENYWQLCKSCHTKYDEINVGEKSYSWKGGKPGCLDCGKIISRRFNKTGLCISCKNKKFPSRKGYAYSI